MSRGAAQKTARQPPYALEVNHVGRSEPGRPPAPFRHNVPAGHLRLCDPRDAANLGGMEVRAYSHTAPTSHWIRFSSCVSKRPVVVVYDRRLSGRLLTDAHLGATTTQAQAAQSRCLCARGSVRAPRPGSMRPVALVVPITRRALQPRLTQSRQAAPGQLQSAPTWAAHTDQEHPA
jgi:hypothetical protein